MVRKLDIPTVPVIPGILSGGHMENALRRVKVLSDGDAMYLRDVLRKPQAVTVQDALNRNQPA